MDPAVVDVAYEERYWYPHDGGVVWIAGYQLVDPESGRYLAGDAPQVAAAGLVVASVAGAARHHAQALADEDAVAPGRALTLRRDPGNEHDPNAIAVVTQRDEALGFVPRELAAELAPQLDRGIPWSAVVLREQRASPRDPRTGVTMLLGQEETLTLVLPAPRE
jgi:HIRAN domain-containing protein